MKRLLALFSIAFLTFLLFWSCSEKEQEIAVASVTISQPTAEMIVGESISLRATISPSNATAREIMWASSKQSVASVDQSGRVVAIAEGTSTITATAGGKIGSCVVTVSKGVVDVSSIKLDKTSASLEVGETITLTATVDPDDATDKAVKWTSSDPAVATVEGGIVTALAVGESTIEASVGDKSASCVVTVIEHQYSIAEIGKLEDGVDILTAPLLVVAKATLGFMVSDETGNLYIHGRAGSNQVAVGDNVQFRALKTTYRDLPELTDLYDLNTLSRGNTINYPTPSEIPEVEQVDVSEAPFNAFTYCKAKGELTSINTQSGGISYNITPSGSLSTNYFLYLFYPYDYQLQSDFYKSIENLIGNGLIVEFEGYFMGLNTSNGALNFLPTSIKTLVTPVSSITLSDTSASLKVGETVTLTATVKPDDATDKTVTWSTSDASVAEVNNGVVTAKKIGTATITAKAGDIEATCAITVEAIPVTAISLNKENIYLTEKGSMSLIVEITPSDATNTTIIWESTNTNVAIVSEGLVQAIGLGTSTIKASSEDGGYSVSCEVNVIHLDEGAVDLGLGVKWASCNIGATSPEEFGYYFAWADTNGYVRNADDTGWVLASDYSVSRLFNEETYKTTPAYSIFVDITPDSGYDAARKNWGGEWRLPKTSEFNGLKNNCDNRLINLNGKDGLLFTSKKDGYTDKSVFFPIDGGYAANDWLGNYDNRCSYYWTNNFVINDEPSYFRCGDRGVGCFYGSIWNYLGINIRPVQ